MADARIIGLLAETSLHPGAGQAAGTVDLPVAREGATGLPHVPDSGLKGALRQWAEDQGEAKFSKADIGKLFGSAEDGGGAGLLLISTARLLCLPVRRLDGPYAWVTTPYLLERLRRDGLRTGTEFSVPELEVTGEMLVLADGTETRVFLEEYVFCPQPGFDVSAMANALIRNPEVAERIARQAAGMSDSEFAWFAANALPVDARNALDDAKMSKALWYEETLPPDTLLYAVIGWRKQDSLIARFFEELTASGYLRVGGNETVGQGWLSVSVCGDT